MAVSKAQQKAVARYEAKAYDKTLIRLPRGKLDEIRDHAEAQGESLNGFIGRAIGEAMKRDSGGMASEITGRRPESTQGAGMVTLPAETLEAAQRAAEASGEGVPQFVARAVETQAQRDKSALRMGFHPVTGDKLKKEVV